MEDLLLILNFAWTVLCIVLFFKIWKMTNNINEIKRHIANEHIENSFQFLYANGKYDDIYEKLNACIYRELEKKVWQYNDSSFSKFRDEVINRHQPFYKKINREIPKNYYELTRSSIIEEWG